MKDGMAMKALLSLPRIYKLFGLLVGGSSRETFVNEYIKPKKGDKILDIGCGTGDIIECLPEVKYTGFDISRRYIDAAKKSYGKKGDFICQQVTKAAVTEKEFDIVLSSGVLHHINDRECIELYDLAHKSLKQHGRLITLDGCYVEDQSILAKYIVSKDRGQYVRTAEQYLALAKIKFFDVKVHIRHDLIRIPYSHIIMECTK